MIEHRVTFPSHGETLAGILRLPDTAGPHPGIVQGPGWLGLSDANLYIPFHQTFCDAGLAVLVFDYRGFGGSGGDHTTLSPAMQLEDLASAVTYLEQRDDIDADRLGVFGSGGTGGGNAVMLAAEDPRIHCAVSQVPVADGGDWLRRMRTPEEWDAFLDRIEADRRIRLAGGEGERVHPRTEIMIPTAERRSTTVKADVDDRIPSSVPLAVAEEIMRYRPIDVAEKSAPLMVVAVEDDETTPTDHAEALYEMAPDPKAFVLQTNTTHYASYAQYGDIVRPMMTDWFRWHLADGTPSPTGHILVGAEG